MALSDTTGSDRILLRQASPGVVGGGTTPQADNVTLTGGSDLVESAWGDDDILIMGGDDTTVRTQQGDDERVQRLQQKVMSLQKLRKSIKRGEILDD